MPDEKFMRLAIDKAREGVFAGQSPFGACIVKEGRAITCVHNNVWKTMDITGHAEIHAIRDACLKLNTVDLSGCQIYSTCEPCPMCFAACHWARINHIIFGAGIADAQAAGFNELDISCEEMKKLGNSPVIITGDFLRKENLELFHLWSREGKRMVY